jgi:hypothetical protein
MQTPAADIHEAAGRRKPSRITRSTYPLVRNPGENERQQ